MPIDGPLMAIDGPRGTAMAIDELRRDLSTCRVTVVFLSYSCTDPQAPQS